MDIRLSEVGIGKRAVIKYAIPEEDIVSIVKRPVNELVSSLNAMLRIPYVVDQSHYKGLVTLKLHLAADETLENIRATLHQYGFDLKRIVRKMDMLVIQDN